MAHHMSEACLPFHFAFLCYRLVLHGHFTVVLRDAITSTGAHLKIVPATMKQP